MAENNCSIQEARMISRQKYGGPPPRKYVEKEWPDLDRSNTRFENYGHKEETKKYQDRKSAKMVTSPRRRTRIKEETGRETERSGEARNIREDKYKKEGARPKNLYKDFVKEEKINRERYKEKDGLVSKYNQEQRERYKEKDSIWMERIDRVISTFEESMGKMTRINEGILKTVEEKRREIRRMQEKYIED